MSALGVGVRVFVGYDPDASEGSGPYLCQTGTIHSGPFFYGDVSNSKGSKWYGKEPGWNVRMDNIPPDANWGLIAIESILLPIDDWDEDIKEKKEVEVEL